MEGILLSRPVHQPHEKFCKLDQVSTSFLESISLARLTFSESMFDARGKAVSFPQDMEVLLCAQGSSQCHSNDLANEANGGNEAKFTLLNRSFTFLQDYSQYRCRQKNLIILTDTTTYTASSNRESSLSTTRAQSCREPTSMWSAPATIPNVADR